MFSYKLANIAVSCAVFYKTYMKLNVEIALHYNIIIKQS